MRKEKSHGGVNHLPPDVKAIGVTDVNIAMIPKTNKAAAIPIENSFFFCMIDSFLYPIS
jgi:hypothetical protein